MPNIKAKDLPISEMKNFEVGLLWSYVPSCATAAGPALTPGALTNWGMNKLDRGLQGDATYKISKLEAL